MYNNQLIIYNIHIRKMKESQIRFQKIESVHDKDLLGDVEEVTNDSYVSVPYMASSTIQNPPHSGKRPYNLTGKTSEFTLLDYAKKFFVSKPALPPASFHVWIKKVEFKYIGTLYREILFHCQGNM